MLATQTIRRRWSSTSETLAEVWLRAPVHLLTHKSAEPCTVFAAFLPASLQKRKTAIVRRKSDDPSEPWQRAGACWPWPLQNHQWSCVTWSACVLLSFSSTQLVIVRSSGSSPPALPPLWGASATSAVQMEVRPSNSFPRCRKETTVFPPFIPHAPPLFSAVVCELCLPLVRKSFFFFLFFLPFFSFCCSWRRSWLFSDQQRLHCFLPEHTGRIATDVLYSVLQRVWPFQGRRKSSVTHKNICELVMCD